MGCLDGLKRRQELSLESLSCFPKNPRAPDSFGEFQNAFRLKASFAVVNNEDADTFFDLTPQFLDILLRNRRIESHPAFLIFMVEIATDLQHGSAPMDELIHANDGHSDRPSFITGQHRFDHHSGTR